MVRFNTSVNLTSLKVLFKKIKQHDVIVRIKIIVKLLSLITLNFKDIFYIMSFPVLHLHVKHYTFELYTEDIPSLGSIQMIPLSKLLQTVLVLTFILAIMEGMDILNSKQLHILCNNLPQVGCIYDYKKIISALREVSVVLCLAKAK